ncbi:transcription factor AbaA [Aspergillus luchuensis]|uniref:Transcription factor AbaA n=1 Tax=Aspergillus kawachii TaxID=1069201 RepID=A0A146FZ51_ASPKA|nr:transcription factor AbaA [Aspergillus luchuensis]
MFNRPFEAIGILEKLETRTNAEMVKICGLQACLLVIDDVVLNRSREMPGTQYGLGPGHCKTPA